MTFDLNGFFDRAEMFSVMDEAASHLRVALVQILPTDDQIIMGHVREALSLLELKEPEPMGFIEKGLTTPGSSPIYPIKNETDYRMALARVEIIFDAELNTPEGYELDALVTLIEAYENKHYPLVAPSVIGMQPTPTYNKAEGELDALRRERDDLRSRSEFKDGECFTCKKHTSSLAGNPSLWPLWLTYHGGNGKWRCYHYGCVTAAVASEARAAQLEAALRRIADKPCGVWHQGEGGPTCLGVLKHARENPERYVDKFRAEILNKEHLCDSCFAKDVCEAALSVPVAQHTPEPSK